MDEIIIKCPNCGANNYFNPPEIVRLGHFDYIRCGNHYFPHLSTATTSRSLMT